MAIKFKGRKFSLLVFPKRLPNGVKIQLEMIDHPGAALMVPFVNKNKLIMLRQYRAVFNQYLYEFPAGTLDKGENPLACARRELAEETGFTAQKFSYLGKIYPVPGYSNEIIFIYKAQTLKPQKAQRDKDEVLMPIILSKRKVI